MDWIFETGMVVPTKQTQIKCGTLLTTKDTSVVLDWATTMTTRQIR